MSIVYINDIKQKCPKFLNTIPTNHNMMMKTMSTGTHIPTRTRTRIPIPTPISTRTPIPTHITI
jgi:hypothetical protein